MAGRPGSGEPGLAADEVDRIVAAAVAAPRDEVLAAARTAIRERGRAGQG